MNQESREAYLKTLHEAIDYLETVSSVEIFDIAPMFDTMIKKVVSKDAEFKPLDATRMGDLTREVAITRRVQTKEHAFAVAGDLVLEYVFKFDDPEEMIEGITSEISEMILI